MPVTEAAKICQKPRRPDADAGFHDLRGCRDGVAVLATPVQARLPGSWLLHSSLRSLAGSASASAHGATCPLRRPDSCGQPTLNDDVSPEACSAVQADLVSLVSSCEKRARDKARTWPEPARVIMSSAAPQRADEL